MVVGLLLTFLLGGILGGYMSSQAGHSVGAEGGRTFLFGWNRSGGDLRIAHFLGIHAEQAIPILAALRAEAGLGNRARWAGLVARSGGLCGADTEPSLPKLVAGQPLFPM